MKMVSESLNACATPPISETSLPFIKLLHTELSKNLITSPEEADTFFSGYLLDVGSKSEFKALCEAASKNNGSSGSRPGSSSAGGLSGGFSGGSTAGSTGGGGSVNPDGAPDARLGLVKTPDEALETIPSSTPGSKPQGGTPGTQTTGSNAPAAGTPIPGTPEKVQPPTLLVGSGTPVAPPTIPTGSTGTPDQPGTPTTTPTPAGTTPTTTTPGTTETTPATPAEPEFAITLTIDPKDDKKDSKRTVLAETTPTELPKDVKIEWSIKGTDKDIFAKPAPAPTPSPTPTPAVSPAPGATPTPTPTPSPSPTPESTAKPLTQPTGKRVEAPIYDEPYELCAKLVKVGKDLTEDSCVTISDKDPVSDLKVDVKIKENKAEEAILVVTVTAIKGDINEDNVEIVWFEKTSEASTDVPTVTVPTVDENGDLKEEEKKPEPAKTVAEFKGDVTEIEDVDNKREITVSKKDTPIEICAQGFYEGKTDDGCVEVKALTEETKKKKNKQGAGGTGGFGMPGIMPIRGGGDFILRGVF